MSVAPVSVSALSRRLEAGESTAAALVEDCAERIRLLDPRLRAFVAIDLERARADAEASDRRRLRGSVLGPLDGMPFAVKDLFDVASEPTRAGSRDEPSPAVADAAAVAALRAAGAVLIGRTAMDELAYGMTCWPTRNGRDPERSPGGSSGGSAAAVASGEIPFALGSDTGGSVQVPAGLNGVVGFKPGHGVVDTAGMVPLSPSLDHVGLFAATVEDAALVFAALAHGDLPAEPSGAIGVVDATAFGGRASDAVLRRYEETRRRLAEAGIALPPFAAPLSERYHEVEDGVCVPEFAASQADRVRANPQAYRQISRRWIEAGAGFPESEYRRALHLQACVRRQWEARLGDLDAVMTPIAPICAPPYGTSVHTWPDGTAEELDTMLGRFSNAADITGFPSICVPAGADEDGLAFGVQLIGRPREERRLLELARRIAPVLAGGTSTGRPADRP